MAIKFFILFFLTTFAFTLRANLDLKKVNPNHAVNEDCEYDKGTDKVRVENLLKSTNKIGPCTLRLITRSWLPAWQRESLGLIYGPRLAQQIPTERILFLDMSTEFSKGKGLWPEYKTLLGAVKSQSIQLQQAWLRYCLLSFSEECATKKFFDVLKSLNLTQPEILRYSLHWHIKTKNQDTMQRLLNEYENAVALMKKNSKEYLHARFDLVGLWIHMGQREKCRDSISKVAGWFKDYQWPDQSVRPTVMRELYSLHSKCANGGDLSESFKKLQLTYGWRHRVFEFFRYRLWKDRSIQRGGS